MLRMLKNRLYRFHSWLDKKESSKFIIMLLLVGVPNAMIVFSDRTSPSMLFGGVALFMFTCLLALTRMNYISGKWKFNKSAYNIPLKGEQIVIKKSFWYDGGFLKNAPNPTDPSRKPNTILIPAGTTAKVKSIRELSDDWEILLSFEPSLLSNSVYGTYTSSYSSGVTIPYIESRKHWKTKSDVRNDILTKIGI